MAKKYAKLDEWNAKVRRDILALEIWAKTQDPCFVPGGPAVEAPDKVKEKNNELKAVHKWLKIDGDPGDPPTGPYGGNDEE